MFGILPNRLINSEIPIIFLTAKTLKEEFAKKGVSITAVIKGVTGSPEVANAILECGITTKIGRAHV